ncbi:MAG: hypothetical protein FWE58_06145 [Methanobrevibacter sp.]|nr:hypothetical protein [Methanobrevibacter sp.]
MNEKEIEHARLVLGLGKAKDDAELELSRKKLSEFKRKNPKLVDEIQRRRWTIYGS